MDGYHGSCTLATAPASAARTRDTSELRFWNRRFEELDRVAGGVLQKHLLAADAGHDLVSEPGPLLAQPRNHGFDVIDLELEPIPPAGLGEGPVRHSLPTARAAAGRRQHESQLAT